MHVRRRLAGALLALGGIFDGADLAVTMGLCLMWAGLWMTVQWWAFVVIGALLFALGVAAALLSRPHGDS